MEFTPTPEGTHCTECHTRVAPYDREIVHTPWGVFHESDAKHCFTGWWRKRYGPDPIPEHMTRQMALVRAK